MTLVLTKHHGLGNDFLVVLDFDDRLGAVAVDLARSLCERHRGIGADGLIRVTPGTADADVTMHLHNADGGRAEMSGNGIRCMAQAVVDAGAHGGYEMAVATDGGLRRLMVLHENERGLRQVEVEMGAVRIDRIDDTSADVNVGNPHLVIHDADGSRELLAEGEAHPEVNVELIAARGGAIDLRVHERGVGVTEACGTGSCAAAAAARRWGLVGDQAVVHNPGGDVTVRLEDDRATLIGPTQFVARIEVPWSRLPEAAAASAGER